MKISPECENCPGAAGICEGAKEKIRKSKINVPDVSGHPFTAVEGDHKARKDLSRKGPFFHFPKPKNERVPVVQHEEIQTDDVRKEQQMLCAGCVCAEGPTQDMEVQTLETGEPPKEEESPKPQPKKRPLPVPPHKIRIPSTGSRIYIRPEESESSDTEEEYPVPVAKWDQWNNPKGMPETGVIRTAEDHGDIDYFIPGSLVPSFLVGCPNLDGCGYVDPAEAAEAAGLRAKEAGMQAKEAGRRAKEAGMRAGEGGDGTQGVPSGKATAEPVEWPPTVLPDPEEGKHGRGWLCQQLGHLPYKREHKLINHTPEELELCIKRKAIKDAKEHDKLMEDISVIEDGIAGKEPTVKECLTALDNAQRKDDEAKEQMHRDWVRYVFRYIQDQVDRNMDALSVDDIMNKNTHYHYEYINQSNHKRVFRDIINLKEYDPFARARLDGKYTISGLRDPLKHDITKEETEKRFMGIRVDRRVKPKEILDPTLWNPPFYRSTVHGHLNADDEDETHIPLNKACVLERYQSHPVLYHPRIDKNLPADKLLEYWNECFPKGGKLMVEDVRTEEKKNTRPRGRRMVPDVECNTQPKLRISYGGHWAPPPDLDAEVKARRHRLAHVLDRTPYIPESEWDKEIAKGIDRRQEQEIHTLRRIPAREQAEHAGIVHNVPTPGYWPPENIWSKHRFDGFKPPPIIGDPRYHNRTSAVKEHLGVQQGIKPPEKDPDNIPFVWNRHPDNFPDLRNTSDAEKHYAGLRKVPLPPTYKPAESHSAQPEQKIPVRW